MCSGGDRKACVHDSNEAFRVMLRVPAIYQHGAYALSWVRWRCGAARGGRGWRLGGWVMWPFGRGGGHLPLPVRGGRARRMPVYFSILGLLAFLLCGPALQRAAYCWQWLPGSAAAARLRVKVSPRLRRAAAAPSASVAYTITHNWTTVVPMRWAGQHTRAVAARAC